MVFISVNTPTKTRPPVATREKSTLPVRTAEVIQQILGSAECAGSAGDQPARTFSVLSSPEFLAETIPRRSARPPGRMCARWLRRSAPTAALGRSFCRGAGFGGSCFQKDILNLVYLCRHYGLEEVAAYWAQVVTLNSWQQHRIARLVVLRLFGTVTGKRIWLSMAIVALLAITDVRQFRRMEKRFADVI